jgi:hypothetical protein
MIPLRDIERMSIAVARENRRCDRVKFGGPGGSCRGFDSAMSGFGGWAEDWPAATEHCVLGSKMAERDLRKRSRGPLWVQSLAPFCLSVILNIQNANME